MLLFVAVGAVAGEQGGCSTVRRARSPEGVGGPVAQRILGLVERGLVGEREEGGGEAGEMVWGKGEGSWVGGEVGWWGWQEAEGVTHTLPTRWAGSGELEVGRDLISAVDGVEQWMLGGAAAGAA